MKPTGTNTLDLANHQLTDYLDGVFDRLASLVRAHNLLAGEKE
jgi:hypothetical protein